MKEIIKTIVSDFHKRGIPPFIERQTDIPIDSGKIITLIGARRAGKTYVMYQLMSKIRDLTNIIYINFEDERLNLNSSQLNIIIDSYFELYPDKNEEDIYFFFDEIQEIEGWEKFVRRVYDTISKKIFITGSSSKLLSREVATSIRGRTVTYEIFPLSFSEFLFFKGVEEDINSTKGKSKLISEVEKYMLKGGFPEIINQSEEFSLKILRDYFEVMIYRDIAERHNINNIVSLKLFIKKLLINTSKETSINKIYNELKSQGLKISKDSLYEYLDYSTDAFIVFPLNSFSESVTKQSVRKIYSIDTGLSSMLSFNLSQNRGRLLENMVFLELKRGEKQIYYYKGKNECDFIIKDKDRFTEAIQVCLKIDASNIRRELDGLKEAMTHLKIAKGTIISFNEETEIEGIKVVPIWKWLL